MPLPEMTYSERMRHEGRQEGREEGRDETRKLLLRLIELKFGPTDESLRRRVEALDSPDALREVGERILAASSVDELGLPTL